MTRHDIFNEVLAGLRDIKEFETGRQTLRTYRMAPRPLPVIIRRCVPDGEEGQDRRTEKSKPPSGRREEYSGTVTPSPA